MALKSKPISQVREVPQVQMPDDEIVRININVPKSLRKKWKNIATDRDTTITELIIESMSKHLSE